MGQVDFEEFSQMLEREKRQSHEEELTQLFNVFDADNKGYISAERLQRTLSEMGERGLRTICQCFQVFAHSVFFAFSLVTLAEAQAMIKYADLDGDSKVSREDFVRVFK